MSSKRKSAETAAETSDAKRAAAVDVLPEDADADLLDAITVDVATLGTDASAFSARFKTIAQSLFCDYVLILNGKEFRFAELEAYFTCETHNDPFTHKDVNQSQKALFYFHRMKGGYKGGTYKGMDISLGNSQSEVGGMLVRSIVQTDTGEVTCGPSLCVDKILSTCGADSIADLVDNMLKKDIGVLGREKIIHIRRAAVALPRDTVLASPRIGLNMKKLCGPELQKSFLARFYRYVSASTAKDLTKRKNTMAVAAVHTGVKNTEKIFNTTASRVRVWVEEFEAGKKENPDIYLNTNISDTQAVRCMGALFAAGYPLE